MSVANQEEGREREREREREVVCALSTIRILSPYLESLDGNGYLLASTLPHTLVHCTKLTYKEQQ